MPMLVPSILSQRLDLVSLSPEIIEALLSGRRENAEALLGCTIAAEWPRDVERVLRRRLEQMRQDASVQSWLLRAMVLREAGRLVIGHINFHGRPDGRGTVEVGYSVLPAYRRQGYAGEAVIALFTWAFREHGINHFAASVRPDNEPSLALVRKLGFRQTGRQWDEEDGEELVFELLWDP